MDAPPHNLRPRYNVCPTDPVDVVTVETAGVPSRRCVGALYPDGGASRSKKCEWPRSTRAETVETKPFFRDAFKRMRCLIPVSGYYEWQATPAGKQPWYFTASDGSPLLTAAGLWDEWKDRTSSFNRRPHPERRLGWTVNEFPFRVQSECFGRLDKPSH
jgi:putative SOS response-associated peptidase YedK